MERRRWRGRGAALDLESTRERERGGGDGEERKEIREAKTNLVWVNSREIEWISPHWVGSAQICWWHGLVSLGV